MWGWARWVKKVKWFKLTVISELWGGNYSMATIVNSTISHICELLKEWILKFTITRKKIL